MTLGLQVLDEVVDGMSINFAGVRPALAVINALAARHQQTWLISTHQHR
jgi:hypothetical protein